MPSNDAARTRDTRAVDGEPFDDIMTELNGLKWEPLLLINSCEAEPPTNVLEELGFTYETTAVESDG